MKNENEPEKVFEITRESKKNFKPISISDVINTEPDKDLDSEEPDV